MSRKLKNGFYYKWIPLNTLIMLVFLGLLLVFIAPAKESYTTTKADVFEHSSQTQESSPESTLLTFHQNTLSPFHIFPIKEKKVLAVITEEEREYRAIRTKETVITAYSSTVDQTDSTPFITASGAWVRDGIVAANFLPFGTKIRIPAFFGDKVFVVKDRMNRRHAYRVDIWFPSRQEAINFGLQNTKIEILEQM